MIVILLLSFVILLLTLWWLLLYYHFYNTLLHIPRPWLTVPILGCFLDFRNPKNAFWQMHKWIRTVGNWKIVRGSLAYSFGLVVADPVILEVMMTRTATLPKAVVYNFLHKWLGEGLLTSTDDKWRTRRKLLTPAYHFKILEQFIDVYDKNGNILVEKLQSVQNTNRVDIYPYITLCALDIICGILKKSEPKSISRQPNVYLPETAMGTSVNAQQNSESDFVKATHEMKRIFTNRAVSFIKFFDFTYQFSADYRTEKKMLQILHNYTSDVIVARRKELLHEQAEQRDNDQDVYTKKKVPFLDLLLQASLSGSNLSDEDIREEVDTFMFEGHDTVTAAISFCIHSISKNPLIQKRLIAEQHEIFLDQPLRETVYNDLQRMKYLEMVIKETLRLYPSVPFIARRVSQDFKYGEGVIKKGINIIFCVYSVHRNPEIYPNPEVFDPERFTQAACANRHPFAYLPFSAGYRNCIGQKFAMLEMKATISKLLRSFQFTDAPNSDLKLKSEIILNSATGVHVGIQKRVWI